MRNKSSRDGLERAVYVHKCGTQMGARILESSVAVIDMTLWDTRINAFIDTKCGDGCEAEGAVA